MSAYAILISVSPSLPELLRTGKVSARIRQQTEPLTPTEHVMCLRVQTKPDRGTLRNSPRCWDFLVSKFNSSGRARRYCDAAAPARRIGKTGGIAHSHVLAA